ncbi:MAG: ATP-binding protein [Candidatus Competibacter sp.]
MNPPPPLPYAPRRRKPLSLWNPLDYLVLLYWVFYFPQALRWYVETFSELPVDANGKQAVRQDAIQRRLALQGLLVMIAAAFGLALFLSEFGLEVNWFSVAAGMAAGVALGVAGAVGLGVATGMAAGVALGVVGAVGFGVAVGVVGAMGFGVAGAVAAGVAVGVALGVVTNVLVSMVGGMAWSMSISLEGTLLQAVSGAVSGAVVGAMGVGVARTVAFSVAAPVAFSVAMLRPDAILLALLPILLQPSKRWAIILQRVSPIPMWKLYRRLVSQLKENWQKGLKDCEGLLRYSLQYSSVVTAIQKVLRNTPNDLLLSHIANWCSMPLYDWDTVLYQVVDLRVIIHQHLYSPMRNPGKISSSDSYRAQLKLTPYLDTPIRAACAGFWHLHEGELSEAADGFAAVRHLPHGEELYANSQALAAASQCQTLEQIAAWRIPPPLQDKLLRPQVRAAFTRLAEVAKNIDLVLHARSTRPRNSALNRASGKLHFFSAESADCPTPERPLLEKIAARWLETILANADAVGTLEAREAVASPYIVGAPVPATRLVGRQDILAQIESAWAKPGQRDSLVIFGHRRMGKTSVARNVPNFCRLGDDTRLAFLNLQIVDWSEGLHDLCHAIAFALWEAEPDSLDEPASEDYEQHPLAALRRSLSRLAQPATPRRYILILDEYELLEESLPDALAGDRTALLRGLSQQYPWLALGLVGLHSLKERSASLREAIFGWRPIPVGLMDRDAFADLLQIDDDAFPLEYDLDAIDRAHALTGGQPFLGQLLGDSLVQRFNQQLKQQIEPPAPTFTAADVDAVVEDAQFYLNGHVYFNGIWAQAGETPPGQHALLKILVNHVGGLNRDAWREESGLDPGAFDAALDALERHDVVTCQNGLCGYSVELMRRWVADYSTLSH